MPLSRIVLVAAVAFFALYLVLQFRPRAKHKRTLDASIREARARAHAAKTPSERAKALADAGDAAARAHRWVAAAGFFLRAMRAEPQSVEAVNRAADGLRPRPRMAEQLLWRRLGALEPDASDRAVIAALAGSLASLYEGPLHDRGKAHALRRLESHEKT